MFRRADKVLFNQAREAGMGILAGFVMLGAGASLSPAAEAVRTYNETIPALDRTPALPIQVISSSLTLPEPASPWLYSIAGGLCLLILAL